MSKFGLVECPQRNVRSTTFSRLLESCGRLSLEPSLMDERNLYTGPTQGDQRATETPRLEQGQSQPAPEQCIEFSSVQKDWLWRCLGAARRRRAGIGGDDWLGSTTKPKAMLSGGSCWFPSQAAARGANNARIMAEARTHIRRGMGFMGVR